MANQKYKLLTADLSQVCCDDKSKSTVNEFASASIKESRTDVRYEENNDESVIAKMFEVSTAENRDPISSQRRPAGTKRCDSSDFASKLNTSRTSPTKAGYLYRTRSQPHHKCPSKNQALSSIMKSPRYSASNTGRFYSSATKPPRMRHNSMSAAMPSTLSPLQSKPRRNSADQWIASGVVFNSSVEVYLFTSD